MLHHSTKKKAAAKFGGLMKEGKTKEEVTVLMKEEEFTDEEMEEIFTAISEPIKVNNLKVSEEKKPSPNDALDLSGFEYKILKDAKFKEYVELVGDRSFVEIVDGMEVPVRGSLLENDSYDFDLYKAKPLRKDRFPGMKDTPKDYVGIEIINDTPVHTTRMTVKTMLELNGQILNQHSIAGHGKYYLLKK